MDARRRISIKSTRAALDDESQAQPNVSNKPSEICSVYIVGVIVGWIDGVVGVEVKDGVLDEDGVVGDNIDDCMLVLSVVKDGV